VVKKYFHYNETKKFNGKAYFLCQDINEKRHAVQFAKGMRKDGTKARVVKVSSGGRKRMKLMARQQGKLKYIPGRYFVYGRR